MIIIIHFSDMSIAGTLTDTGEKIVRLTVELAALELTLIEIGDINGEDWELVPTPVGRYQAFISKW